MGSDSHIKYTIGNVDRCLTLLQELNFPEELIDKEHMELIFYDGVRGYLKTIRDCNRLINTINEV